jgi:metallo-beta-lactamase family protein
MSEQPELKKISVTFWGGVGTVTGANFLLQTEPPGADSPNDKILVDCGLFQGPRVADDPNYHPFPYNPAEIKALFITHAHLDHIGRIPKLVHDGFRGKIYSTSPTKEIAALSLEDSLGVLAKEQRQSVEGHVHSSLYDKKDIELTMSLWQTLKYHEEVAVGSFVVRPLDAGHVLGSAMYEFNFCGKKLVFTGDLGNSPAPLLPDTEIIKDANYLVIESVYGDRNHEDRGARREKLEDAIENTMRNGGTLVIPAFSIERTQEMLYEIERMMEESRIPLVPVFIDSPLAIHITEIYKKYDSYLNKSAESTIKGAGGIFAFPQLHQTLTTGESRGILDFPGKKIIIAGSGMSNGGRVIHHEKHYLPDPKNALLLVGYQAAGSLGRQILDGAKSVRILGEEVSVKAKIINISGYSAHRDSQGLMDFIYGTSDSLEKVFVTMGEPKASLFLVQKVRDYLGLEAVAPQMGETITITC